jgi:predicted phosphodiesterase
MKILCVSDQIDPLVYSGAIKERFGDVDMILSAGDLPLDYLDFIVSSLNKPLLFVFGNHHTEGCPHSRRRDFSLGFEEPGVDFSGLIHAGSKVRREAGLIVAGLGGSMRYNKGDNQFTEFQMGLEICRMVPALLFNRLFRGRYLDVLLTHASPRGIHDREDRCHIGFRVFRTFMRLFKPRYLVHGHIHLYDLSEVRKTLFERTMVINAFGHYVIDTAEEHYGT